MARIALFAGSNLPLDASAHRKKVVLPSAPVKSTSLKESSHTSSGHSTGNVVGEKPKDVVILCFSKDRPFQLEQFLISKKRHVENAGSQVKIIVLFSPGNYQILYFIPNYMSYWVVSELLTAVTFSNTLMTLMYANCSITLQYLLLNIIYTPSMSMSTCTYIMHSLYQCHSRIQY